MGKRSELVTPDNSGDDSGDAFTDGDFGDSDEERRDNKTVNESLNKNVKTNGVNGKTNGNKEGVKVNGHSVSGSNSTDQNDGRKDSLTEQSPTIIGILGEQHNHAEQRLAARRAARAEAREIRMRELERQQREQEDHADKAYDMYSETSTSVRRGGPRLSAISPGGLHSPRRSSEDSANDVYTLKEMRHSLKELEEKFRKAMILNAQLDNDKAALQYQLELLADRIDELQEEHAQLQREHKERVSSHERLKREHASLDRELTAARDAIRARDHAASVAGFAFVEGASVNGSGEGDGGEGGEEGCMVGGFGVVPPLALISQQADQALGDAAEGTLDVRLQKLVNAKVSLETEVRRLKLQLNEERTARQNGAASQHDEEYESEMETLRKSCAEAKARAARAEAEAALAAAGSARLEAQLGRVRAANDEQLQREHQLQQERRRLQRESREALNRVEELETENSHLTKRLDKLKNAKSTLLKEL